MWKRSRQALKTLKTEAFVNAWTHKMWQEDSEAMIFSIRFVLREFMWHLEKENISGLSLHIVSEQGQLPDWGGARGWRQALCRWHPVRSFHLPLDSTSAVPPCFPGLVRSTRLLVCFSPWALRPAHPAQHPVLSGWQEPSLPLQLHSASGRYHMSGLWGQAYLHPY